MKIIAFLLVALLGVSYAFPPPLPSKDDSKVHIPEKCSDVLAVKVCQNLEAIAVRLQLKAKDVTRAVIDAVKQGKTSSMEIYEVAKEFLKKEVLSKKCEDFTTAEVIILKSIPCLRLRIFLSYTRGKHSNYPSHISVINKTFCHFNKLDNALILFMNSLIVLRKTPKGSSTFESESFQSRGIGDRSCS